jgi:hypothetical protein
MKATVTLRLSQFLTLLQELFPLLREELALELTPALEKVIRVLELVQVERFGPVTPWRGGRAAQGPVGLGAGLCGEGGAESADH